MWDLPGPGHEPVSLALAGRFLTTAQPGKPKTQALNDTLNKMNLTDIYKTFHPKTTEYTFFSSAHGTYSKIDHILGHK